MKKILVATITAALLLFSAQPSKSIAAVNTRTIYRVSVTALNLRSAPKISSKLIGSLKNNEEVILISKSGEWSKIQTKSGKTGYAYSKYLKYNRVEKASPSSSSGQAIIQSTSANQSSGRKVYYVTTNALNLRSTPQISSKNTIGSLRKNEEVYLISSSRGWLKVETKYGKIGHAYSQYLRYLRTDNTPNQNNSTLSGIVDITKSMYTYEDMMEDIKELQSKYSKNIAVETIGKSVMGFDIPSIILGSPDAQRKIMIYGSTHGCEYMTTQLIMKQVEYYLENYDTAQYRNTKYSDIMNTAAIYFIPSINPDGVQLSQKGLGWIKDESIKQNLLKMNNGSNDFTRWKATITGVNLNSNFDAYWDRNSESEPGRLGNRGSSPESEPEAKAIADYTRLKNFDSVISYHSTGSLIYWYYNQEGDNYVRDRALSQELAAISGYSLVPETQNAGFGGFRNWFVMEYDKPAFTIEIGKSGSPSPLNINEFDAIWESNREIPLHLAYKVMEGKNN